MLPLALPGIAATAIFAFVISWNEVFAASVLTVRERTLTAYLLTVLPRVPLHYRFAGGFILIIPSVLFIFAVRRYLFAMWGVTEQVTEASHGRHRHRPHRQDLRRRRRRWRTCRSTVADGEFVALLGPSGCGKTTLLRIIAGLETQSAGRVLIGGRDVSDLPPRRARPRHGVPELRGVPAHDGVRQRRLRPAHAEGADRRTSTRKVERGGRRSCTSSPISTAIPAKLSGGQRQRVAVARALAVEPAVLLMDEPLSNLDALLRLEMRAELKSVLREAGTTTIYVTHDQTEAMGLADRIAVMHGGHIVQMDAPTQVYRTPRRPSSAASSARRR